MSGRAEGGAARIRAVASFPTGSVTFLITDIEGSTRLLIALEADYAALLEKHNAIVRRHVSRRGGMVVSTSGDSVFAVFTAADDAVAAAADIQYGLDAATWPRGARVLVRMGLHTGVGVLGGDDYVGIDVHRTARISASGHGGQVLLSATTRDAVDADLPPGVQLRDLGEHRLKDLVRPERLYQMVLPGVASDFSAINDRAGRVRRLPVPRTSYVPRSEQDAVVAALTTARIVTLTGPGGTGKTRLATQVALESADRYADGTVLVDLSSVQDAGLVPAAIADRLQPPLGGTATPESRIAAWLHAHPQALLVLDNFEQVLDAAPAVSDLLDQAAQLTVLVTSRAPLRIRGEVEVRVPPLPTVAKTADGDETDLSPAAQLFVDRARTVDPTLSLDEHVVDAAEHIVAMVDGLPLAIELAASRASVLAISDIALRLKAAGGLDLLGHAGRDAPARHKTVRSVIDWSYQLLEPSAQRAFRQLSLFSGGAEADQVERVLAPASPQPLDDLQTLVEQSLAQRQPTDGVVRLSMLTTIREFALEKLVGSGEWASGRSRHAHVYCHLAEQLAPELLGWDQKRALDRLERDYDNLRVAMDWAVDAQETELAWRLGYAMWRFEQVRGHLDEARARLARALDLPGGDPRARALALEAAGGLDWWRGRMTEAQDSYADSLALMLDHGSPGEQAQARYNWALTLAYTDTSAERGMAALEQARRDARDADDRSLEAWATWGMCDARFTRGDSDLAYRAAMESLAMFRELDDPFGIGWAEFMAANALMGTTRTDEARSLVLSSMALFARFEDMSALVLGLWALAQVQSEADRLESAVMLAAMSEALRVTTGAGIIEANSEVREDVGRSAVMEKARGALGARRVEELTALGARHSAAEALAFALSLEQPPHGT